MKQTNRLPIATVTAGAFLFLMPASPVLAQTAGADLPLSRSVSTAGFLLLLPLGLILLLSSALPNAHREAPQAAVTALVVWGVAVLAYFAAGFAFQFGGLAVVNAHPDFAELYWNWSPLPPSYGPTWGVIGLRGWALLGPAATPGVYDLFLRQAALLGVAVVMPAFTLYQKVEARLLILFGLVAGALIYPLAGNWVWSAGWLANLGINQGQGHGFVDAGMAMPFALAGTMTLTALFVFRKRAARPEASPLEARDEFAEIPMPTAHLPLLGFLGLGLVLWSWAFVANGRHIPTAVNVAVSRAALNGFLGAFAGLTLAALYSRFTTMRFDGLMTVRGGLAGLVLVSAAAPFIAPWQAVAAGGVAGLLTPLLIYFVDHRLKLVDFTGGVVSGGVMGVLGWLLVGLPADGTAGAGWNAVGEATYLGVSGQGVTGLLAAAGRAIDWPGQMNAQLLGAAAVIGWTLLISGGLFKGYEILLARRERATGAVEVEASAKDGEAEVEIGD